MTKPLHFSLAALWLVLATPAVSAALPLKDTTYEYGPDAALAPLDKTIQLALLDSGWVPLAVTASEITAEIHVRTHYARIRVHYGSGKATFTLIESRNLDAGPCKEWVNGKDIPVDSCIHPTYYEWLESLMASLPLEHAKLLLLQAAANWRQP